MLQPDALATIIAAPCPGCAEPALRLRLLVPAEVELLDGDVVSAPAWRLPVEELAARVVSIDCPKCGRELYARSDCPRCLAAGGAARAMEGRNGVTPPRACPRCGLESLTATVELRWRQATLHGHLSRRVADAEPHEGGWHVVEVRCPDCEEIVAAVGEARCAACGRSSLVRRR
jgi:ssDNA-binding Zn-finger/Zn-ribbon topoisomerase 1